MDTSKFTPEKLVRATRLSLAMLISLAYVLYVDLSEGIAVTMTCAIILYDNPTVGGTINKNNLRFLGTLLGFLISMIFIVGFANSLVLNLAGMIIGVFLAAYWFIDNKYSYIGIMLCATLPMLLINNGDIKGAFLRVLCIGLGVFISYILICFFYPDYARDRILIALKGCITQLDVILQEVFEQKLNQIEIEALYIEQDALIVKEFTKIVRWNTEAQNEIKNCPEYLASAMQVYANIRHIFHLVSVIIFHLDYSENNDYIQSKLSAILHKNQLIIDSLGKNLNSFYMPEEFGNYQILLSSQEVNHDEFKYTDLTIKSIVTIINDELDMILRELACLYNIRKQNNYY